MLNNMTIILLGTIIFSFFLNYLIALYISRNNFKHLYYNVLPSYHRRTFNLLSNIVLDNNRLRARSVFKDLEIDDSNISNDLSKYSNHRKDNNHSIFKNQVQSLPNNAYRRSKYSPTKHRLRSSTSITDINRVANGKNNSRVISSSTILLEGSNLTYAQKMENALYYAKKGQGSEVIQIIHELLDTSSNIGSNRDGIGGGIKVVNLVTCNIIIKELGDQGCLEYCDDLVSILKFHNITLSIITYTTLISRAGTWKKINLAEKYFNQMLLDGITGDVQVYNSLMNAYAKVGNVKKALETLNRMLKAQIEPSIVTFNTLIDACARDGDVHSAQAVFELMKQRKFKPNARTYSALIHTYCQARQLTKALDLMQKMIDVEKLQPTAVTYTLLLDALGRAGQLSMAFELLENMKQNNIEPNVVTMTSMIHACGLHGKLDLAFQFYEQMQTSERKEYQPNSITCSALVDLYLKDGQIDRAFSIVRDMRDRQLVLTEVTYTSLITELTRLGELERIVEVVLGEPGEGVPPRPSEPRYRAAVFPMSARTIAMPRIAVSDDEITNNFSINEEEYENKAYQDNVFFNDELNMALIQNNLFTNNIQDRLRQIMEASKQTNDALEALWNMVQLKDDDPSSAVLRIVEDAMSSVGYILDHSESMKTILEKTVSDHLFALTTSPEDFNMVNFQSITLNKPPHKVADTSIQQEQESKKENNILVPNQIAESNDNDGTINIGLQDFNEELLTQRLSSPVLRTYGSYIDLMEKVLASNDHETLVQLYTSMRQEGIEPDARVYKTLMDSIYKNSIKSKAPNTLPASTSDGEVSIDSIPDAATTELNKQRMRQNELFRLYLVFQEMRIAGVEADAAVYNTLINACAGAGDLEKALETMAAMRFEGIEADIITYTSLIKACALVSPIVQVNGFDSSYLSNTINTCHSHLNPSITTSKNVIGSIDTSSSSVAVVNEFSMIRNKYPITLAEELFAEMQQRDNHFTSYIAPNYLTYQHLLQVYIKNLAILSKPEYHRVIQLYFEMINRKLSPSIAIHKFCIKVAQEVDNIDVCLSVLENIRNDIAIQYDHRCWQLVLIAIQKHGNRYLEVENQLKSEMNKKPYFPKIDVAMATLKI